MILRRPRPTLFPYATLLRSGPAADVRGRDRLLRGGQGLERRRRAGARHGGEEPTLLHAVPVRKPGEPGQIGRATSELQSPCNLVCRLLLEKKNTYHTLSAGR